jgi:hypothetical protein
MKISKIDFTKKKNQTFKNWFKLMWGNNYIQLFILAIAFLIGEFYWMDTFYSLGGFIAGISIPIGMMILISYKGFYQFWSDIKKGISR